MGETKRFRFYLVFKELFDFKLFFGVGMEDLAEIKV